MTPIINAQGLSKKYGIAPLFHNISFTVGEGDRIGLIGPNGSGKSTLLQILEGRVKPDAGVVALRKRTRLSYVAQHSEFATADTVRSVVEKALERGSAPEAERASRLAERLGRAGFTDFETKAAELSGGWRKRLAILEGLVQEPDILLLDEPTNDLDIPTLEILEESLLEFRGALVLVTHDRYMMDRVSTIVLGLDGMGEAHIFADYSQWDEWQRSREAKLTPKAVTETQPARATETRRKLSYLEAREFATIEERIAEAEKGLRAKRTALEDPSIRCDGPRLLSTCSEIEEAQKIVDDLYARWAELEQKQD